MLSLTSRNSAALVGVFISVTTVPAAGYVAVGGVLGEWSQVWGSAVQLLINLAGIVVAAVAMLLARRWGHRFNNRTGNLFDPDRRQRTPVRS